MDSSKLKGMNCFVDLDQFDFDKWWNKAELSREKNSIVWTYGWHLLSIRSILKILNLFLISLITIWLKEAFALTTRTKLILLVFSLFLVRYIPNTVPASLLRAFTYWHFNRSFTTTKRLPNHLWKFIFSGKKNIFYFAAASVQSSFWVWLRTL